MRKVTNETCQAHFFRRTVMWLGGCFRVPGNMGDFLKIYYSETKSVSVEAKGSFLPSCFTITSLMHTLQLARLMKLVKQ